MKTTFFALAALLMISQSASAGIWEHGGRRAPMATEIQFMSIGSGVDSELKKEILQIIEEYKHSGAVRLVTETPWGREGESTLCVEFSKIQDAREFNNLMGEVIGSNGQLTTYKQTLSCDPHDVIDPRH